MAFTEEQAIVFLKDNPDFFNKHPDVLDNMNFPGQENSGGVVDFQSRMLNKLKTDNQKAKQIHKEIVNSYNFV